MLPMISGEFGVTQEPEMRFSNDGKPWLKIRGVAKDRTWNSETRQYEDKEGSTMYIDITVGGKTAENLAESVTVGDNITIANGTLTMREWTNDAGVTQKAYSIRANDVGVSTRFGPAPSAKSRGTTAPAPKAQEEVAPW
jgi:single-stranded DNA-binding protein